jgi:hypothetical protein
VALTDVVAAAPGPGHGAVGEDDARDPAGPSEDLHTQPTMTFALPALSTRQESEPAFLARLPPRARAFYDRPAVFPAVFGAGFIVSFLLVALVTWRGPTPERLLDEGRADQLLASLPSTNPSPGDALWRGHALRLKGERVEMIRMYQRATAGGVVDERALDNTLEALGHPAARALAIQTLAGWNDNDLDVELSTLAGDGNRDRRHGAVDVLNARASADPERRMRAAVLAAIADVRSDACDEKAEGIAALAALLELPRARKHLRDLQAWKAVYDQNNGRVFDECRSLNPELVRKTETALGAAESR